MRSRSEVVRDWVSYYKASPEYYQLNALVAIFRADGEGMLASVLKELGLQDSVLLVKDAAKK